MSKNEKEWVSARAVAWVIHDAPVPADLAFTLTVIAARCDEHGRGSYAAVATIAEKTGKSPKQARRNIIRLRELGLLLLGDQSLVDHLPPGQRPVVYDVPLNLCGPKLIKEGRNKTGGKRDTETPVADVPPPMDAPRTPPMDGTPPAQGTPPMDGSGTPPMGVPRPLPSMGVKQPLNNPMNNPSLSGAARTVADATDATPDETREILETIERDHKPNNLAAYTRTLAINGDLPAILRRVRAGDTTPRANGKYAAGTGALAPLPTEQDYATGKVIL
ncbi:helix-turn-helix domain-containing protein [Nonomuraea sp. NPDC004297]